MLDQNTQDVLKSEIPPSLLDSKQLPVITIAEEEADQLVKAGYLVQSVISPTSSDISKIIGGTSTKTNESLISFYYKGEHMQLSYEDAANLGYFKRDYKLIMDDRAMNNLNFDIPSDCEYINCLVLKDMDYSEEYRIDGLHFIIYSRNIKDRFPNQKILRNDGSISIFNVL